MYVWFRKAKATTQSQRKGAGATGLERKVSFNPMVQQKIITPLQRNKRLSMPPAPQAASTSINSHTDSSEPITPVEKLRTFSRYWGVNSP
ncbi:Pre-mRNA-processing factor 31 [Frankliniella fusca]|uniref:Pre-mRNA-processing factor 31 n=1 Tax=Frankliniella fusca TaxID=407009 RepID=A0AAE1GY57_9NEOP|nr:Pre-mRNA-processing factor 31 [Frankliniella fusca]